MKTRRTGVLISSKNPLRMRFTADFFKEIPDSPGVYFFKDANGDLLYIGKAKNLRSRLRSYFYCRPETNSRKSNRLLQLIHWIEWQKEKTEADALIKENELLRSLRPFFNRLNTRPESYYFILIRRKFETWIEIQLSTRLEEGWETHGCFRSRRQTRLAYSSLQRILWLLVQPPPSFSEKLDVPSSLLRNKPASPFRIQFSSPDHRDNSFRQLRTFLKGTGRKILSGARKNSEYLDEFSSFILNFDLQNLETFYSQVLLRNRRFRRLYQKKQIHFIEQEQIDDFLVLHRHPSPPQRPLMENI